MAAALGAGLPVHEPLLSMVVGLGCGTTEMAVLSPQRCCGLRILRAGGDRKNDAIYRHAQEIRLAFAK